MSSVDPETRDLLALHLLPGLGPRLTAALLQRFGSAGAVLRAAAAQLREVPHIGPKLSEDLCQAMGSIDVDAELALIEKHGVPLRRLGQADYPTSLAAIQNPPHLLYVRGRLEPGDTRAIALVGSRHYTGYGRRVAERLAADLARAGYTIVSGLARGIDGIAHRAARWRRVDAHWRCWPAGCRGSTHRNTPTSLPRWPPPGHLSAKIR